MNAQKILFPTDFSSTGNSALAEATSLARDQKATLLILHVEVPPVAYGGEEFYCGPAHLISEWLQNELEKIVPSDKSIPCEHRLVLGSPAQEIIRAARQEQVGLIVMSTHGRTGLKRLLMGSVAEAVVRGAPCPVLVYRAPDWPQASKARSEPQTGRR